jgi:DNA-binding MurR/RpiR family transcriptional regulator
MKNLKEGNYSAMAESEDLVAKIKCIYENLPSRQQHLCHYIMANAQAVCTMPIDVLSKNASVGRATIMRFINGLGFDSYISFKQHLFESMTVHFVADHVSNPFFWPDKPIKTITDSLDECCKESVILMQETVKTIHRADFKQFIELLLNAGRVNTLAFRTSYPLASYTCLQLSQFLDNVRNLSYSESLSFDSALKFNKDDILLIISSNPTTSTSIKIAELCYKKKIPILIITDSSSSSLLKYATCALVTARSESTRLSILPIMLLLEAIFNELGIRTAPVSVQNVEAANRFLMNNRIIMD